MFIIFTCTFDCFQYKFPIVANFYFEVKLLQSHILAKLIIMALLYGLHLLQQHNFTSLSSVGELLELLQRNGCDGDG